MSLSKNKFLLLFFFAFTLFQTSSFAQREIYGDSTSFRDRLFFGGNLGLQFGTVTFIDVSPLVGVMITPRLSGGAGLTYQYYDDNRFQGANGSSYGGRVFGRYNVLPNIFTHVEYENINWNAYNLVAEDFRRTWTDALFVGGGYFAPFGRRGGANFTFLYNVLYDRQTSYYAEPYVIRVGFVL
ncbi:hypothetical protein DFQ04_3348 [Algoriphagus boseongensis]|uniref:Outer membrane protein with beta-barrel domain n=1 Tax=Algoriphagus boseongensis TaxID=1442587 RepID=A0A4R6T2V7_9BACT|nr:hypothetical protein [Algoriphagus boseongensis]TDQ14754.1 hypothetical protein DFQ04_3348 [Algoriphagus boseongensis]